MAEYWFDGTDGSDSNDGLSSGAPKRTINSSVNVSGTCIFNIKRGTTVQLTADRYPTGAFTMRPYGNGSARAAVIWTGGYQLAHVGASGSHQFDPGLKLTVPSGSISAIFSQQAPIYVDGVLVDAAYNAVQTGSGGGYVRNCDISGVRDNGIFIGNDSYAAPSNVEVTGNRIDARGAANTGITFHDGTGTAYGGQISHNYVIGGNSGTDQNNGIAVESQYVGVNVFGNVVIDPSGSGIAISGDNVRAFGNEIYGAGGAAFRLADLAEPSGAVISGNLVYGCGLSRDAVALNASCNLLWYFYNNTVVSIAGVTRVLVSMPVSGATGYLRNNILIAQDSNRYVEVFDADCSLLLASNNLYYGSTRATQFAINNGTGRTLAQWQALTALGGGTQDANSLNEDPFLDASYRPMAGSPCIYDPESVTPTGGIYIPGARHYGGKRLASVPDIGAHRYFAAREIAEDRTVRLVGA